MRKGIAASCFPTFTDSKMRFRMQRLAREVSKCSVELSNSLKTQKRTLSQVSTEPSSSHTTGATPSKPRPSPTKGTNPKPKTESKKRPPVAWPQRPGQDPAELEAHFHKTAIEYPYFVPRNSNGCVPVFSDFKSNRTREITLIRNVEGNVQASVFALYKVSNI